MEGQLKRQRGENQKSPHKVDFDVTGRPGLEPRMTDPESAVLPLNYLPSMRSILLCCEITFKPEF
jgi:hypothetical protein